MGKMSASFGGPHTPVTEYFHSIEKVFESTLARRDAPKRLETIRNTIVAINVFSIIPILPYLSWRLLRSKHIQLYSFTIPLRSFWLWWVAYVACCVVVLLILGRVISKRKGAVEKTWLSRPQLRFALAYALAEEISKYQTNRLQAPIDKAIELEQELWKSLPSALCRPFHREIVYFEYPETPSSQASSGDIDFLRRNYDWFKLQPRTEQIIEAFRAFHDKARDRIKDKKDLNEIGDCFRHLSSYLYSQIPELQPSDTSGQQVPVLTWGEEELLAFAQGINNLPPYSSEEQEVPKQQLIKRNIASRTSRVTAIFSHENIFLCFFAWLCCLAFLVALATWLMMRNFENLKMDSVLVSMIVGTPIIGAATLVAIAKQRRKTN